MAEDEETHVDAASWIWRITAASLGGMGETELRWRGGADISTLDLVGDRLMVGVVLFWGLGALGFDE